MDNSTSSSDDADYRNDPILRPLLDIGMTQRDRDHHKNLPRASILVLFFRFSQHGFSNKSDNSDNNSSSSATDEWYVLFTQRPLHLKSHPGEVCFPGGRQEDSDFGNDVTTALRETMEEVGIATNEVVPIARTETAESLGGLCVTPIVGIWKNPIFPSQLQVNSDEVEAAFYVPLSYFWEEDNCVEKRDVAWRGDTFTMRTYNWKDTMETNIDVAAQKQPRAFKIWGLTAHVIYEVGQLCKPKQPEAPTAGPLYRWMDDFSTSGKPYWAERYFVLVNQKAHDSSRGPVSVLHQYDSERKANTKADTATKKNRLLLDNDTCQVTPLLEAEKRGKFMFTTSVLDGRITWKLAAKSREDRDRWIAALLSAKSKNDLNNNEPTGQVSNKKCKASEKSCG